MADANNTEDTGEGDEEDTDVLWEGSPLHEHLIGQEFDMHATSPSLNKESCTLMNLQQEVEDRRFKESAASPPSEGSKTIAIKESDIDVALQSHDSSILSSAKSFAWPESRRIEVLQVEVARQLLESDLLVQEDEDFVNNFLLTDAALEEYQRYTSEGGVSSVLGDVLLFSGR